jgi:DNA-binding response OmpR family regulator
VCRVLRAEGDRTPILMLTALVETADRIAGLDAGADDYVVKPFSVDHLEARLRAVLRRTNVSAASEDVLRVGELEVNAKARTAHLAMRELSLSRKEFDLLHLLARRAGQVVSKRELLSEVWQQAWGGGDRTVEVHLSWLRRKLGETAADPRYLHSVRGVGVMLRPPDEPEPR